MRQQDYGIHCQVRSEICPNLTSLKIIFRIGVVGKSVSAQKQIRSHIKANKITKADNITMANHIRKVNKITSKANMITKAN
jgi:hypothetical protein